ncbi:FAD-dependent oxidoreductase [Streptococcus sp. S1]|uniref:FAD-dependent oxidoreductase n=1 Tax=Streptococcus dentalis TaxID=3098075 RepID=A0ABZ0SZU7_9STRE|nr:FAD-dependent oxidoreductase [Streptococcus sp. S1]WPS53460.1 FAD-dependent oxidoreductase [Streptococcus sp. S1]
MSKIVVVGANHAGTACINTMLDNFGNENEIVVFDQNSNISFLGCGMALWIGEQIDGPEGLFYSDKEKLEAKGAKVYMNSPVLSIDYDNKVVTAEVDGKEHKESYEKLIFATGSTPIIPPIKGVEIVPGNREFKATLENLQFVKLYQNAEEVIEKLKDNSKHLNRIAVVGGGYIGVELAEAFERLGKDVVLVDIVDTVLNGYYDKDFTDIMAKNLEDHNIRLALGQTVQAVEGDGKIELFRNGAFLVDKKQETSLPGVYAVGDCATIFDNARNEMSYIALASNAVRSGIVGAYNATGHELEGIGVQGSNGISIYGLHMVSTGLTLEKAKAAGFNATETGFNDLQKPEFIKHDNYEVGIKIVYDKDTRQILGAQMVSRDSAISMAIHMFSLVIQEHVTIDKLALTDLFFLPHFNKPYNYITMAALTAE